MKILYTIVFPALLLSCLFFSCKKNNDPGNPVVPPPPPPPLGTMNINLTYNVNSRQAQSTFELIINEPGGKILLDTVAIINTPIVAALRTNDSVVDLTAIYYDSLIGGKYNIITYKSINPTGWTQFIPYSYHISGPTTNPVPATIHYAHPPSPTAPWFNDNPSAGSFGASFGQSIDIQYGQYGNHSLYLLLPASGLYNFHIPKSLADTVDLSHMDTAVKLNFNRPSQYTMNYCALVGIIDTTDFSKSVQVYNNAIGNPAVDLEYPTKNVQSYELIVYAYNTKNERITYYSYGKTVPTTLPFPDESSYTLSSTQNNNFSVKFVSAHPSYYFTTWKSPTVSYQLYASPDSTALNPIALLTALKSKKLQGQDFSGLSLSAFKFENAQGLNYAGFFSYVSNLSLVNARRLPSSVTFEQDF